MQKQKSGENVAKTLDFVVNFRHLLKSVLRVRIINNRKRRSFLLQFMPPDGVEEWRLI